MDKGTELAVDAVADRVLEALITTYEAPMDLKGAPMPDPSK